MAKAKRKWFTMADYEKGLCTKEGFAIKEGERPIKEAVVEAVTEAIEETIEEIPEVIEEVVEEIKEEAAVKQPKKKAGK
jgi:phenylpyruvate tautomerase PptA (4-oxalocrotonate tautomerase family)